MSKQYVEQIVFFFKEREITILPYENSWEQLGYPKAHLLPPEFLDRFWQLLDEYELLEG